MLLKLSALFSVLLGPVRCHSWVERVSEVTLDGARTGEVGYIRGTVRRSSPEFGQFGDELMTYGLVGSTIDLPLCSQRQEVPDSKDVLKLEKGHNVLLEYMENGHITKSSDNPVAKKGKPGFVYVYGTQHGWVSQLFDAMHPAWASLDLSKNGTLLMGSSFDDGRCYQWSENNPIIEERLQTYGPSTDPELKPSRLCGVTVEIPKEVLGFYTLYWIWDYSTTETVEFYTSCLDINIYS